jgi:serine/threonine protein kinase
MSELGVDGPRQIRLSVDSPFYEEIGQGGQFQVFRYTVSDVVAKRVNLHVMVDRNPEQLRDLELEIRALASERIQDHPNIVDLIGWGYDTVYESSKSLELRSDMRFPLRVPVLYVEPAIASLDKFLSQSTSWKARLQMCLDIASALECLRECEILHNDLKPQNVLVFRQGDGTESYVAKLADFGLAITPDENNSRWFSDYGKTMDWKPPESIDYSERKHGICSNKTIFKSESYAYGMLALYTLFSPNTELTPLPFDRRKRIRETQITALLRGVEEVSQDSAMEVWNMIEARFLQERPTTRAEIFPSQLFGDSAFQTW